ncbi:MAG: HupE/UreJ family protein [Acidobacteriota bacterium]
MRAWLAAAALAVALPAGAHPAPFSYLDLRLSATGVEGTLVLHDYDVAYELGISPPERLQDPAAARAGRDRLIAVVGPRLQLDSGSGPLALTWGAIDVLPERQSIRLAFAAAGPRPGMLRLDAYLFPYDPIHQTFVNVYEDGRLTHQAILDARHTRLDYYAGTAQGALAVMRVFVPAGIEHILIGPDHVLFLVGLLLLGGSLWRLAGIVTAFTAGHSVTLSLAALDMVTLPGRLVEPAIALSIVFVGVDNLLMRRDATPGQPAPHDIRAWVAGAFGLIHGFGFASVLREFGLPQSALGWSLFSFNVGVEIGQMAIVLAVASALAAVARRSGTAADRVVLGGSVAVILAGGYWFVERVFLTGGM